LAAVLYAQEKRWRLENNQTPLHAQRKHRQAVIHATGAPSCG